jgi:hypothetical protein
VALDEQRTLQKKVGTRDKLLAHILGAAARIRKGKDQFRRTTRDLRPRVARCNDVDGGTFKHLL